MAQPHLELKEKLSDMGLEQYHDTLINNGFHTWESVLRLSEDDLEALDFKRGHRRRLQRQIATDDGHSLNDPLPFHAESSPNRNSVPLPSMDGWSSSGQGQWNGEESSQSLETDNARPSRNHISDPFGSTANMSERSSEQNEDIEGQIWKTMEPGGENGRANQVGSGSKSKRRSEEYAEFYGEMDNAVWPGRSGRNTEDGVHSGDFSTMPSVFPQDEDTREASTDMMQQFINY